MRSTLEKPGMGHLSGKTIIIGASGFIGRALARDCQNSGLRSVGFSSQDGNLLTKAGLAKIASACDDGDQIVFCANHRFSRRDSLDDMQKNIEIASNFARLLQQKKIRSALYLSSVDVYGLPSTNLPITEKTLPRPTSYYGISKLCSESILQIDLACPLTILRLPGVFGAGDQRASVIGKFAWQISRGLPTFLQKEGSIKRDFIPVQLVVSLIRRLLRQPSDEVINVVTGKSLTIAEWVKLIAARLGKPVKILNGNNDFARARDLIFDAAKLRQIAPEIAQVNIEAALDAYLFSDEEQFAARPQTEQSNTLTA